jgi:Histidine-specific methyltransferase, SAM-dependent
MSDPLRRILASIRARREIPPKYFYFGEGARNWDRYSRDEHYNLGKAEEGHLVRSLPEVLEAIGPGPIDLVDLGPGNGVKAGLILAHDSSRGRISTYAALDISEDILELVRKNGRKLFPGVKARFFPVDFEERSIRPILRGLKAGSRRTALILLLGSGNVTNNSRVLGHVRSAMAFSDFFLMSAELRGPGDVGGILSHYKRRESQNVVFFGLKRLGVRESDGHFVIGFNRRREQAEVAFVFDRSVTAGPAGGLRLRKGTKVLLFTSHKPTARSLKEHLETMGFEIDRFLTHGNGRLALVLCRKSRLR